MPRGGKRGGAGRKKVHSELPASADKKIATQVLDSLGTDWKHKQPDKDGKGGCSCEVCRWRALVLESKDGRLEFDVLKYLTDRRDGKAVQTVNHLHDKPIEMNMNISLGERMRDAMQKAEQRVGNKRS